MRIHGTLTKWKDDRGFGFILPAKGPPEIFVHISEFPREGGRPAVNELISFEVVPGPDGKQRAVRVMRPGQKSARAPGARPRERPQSRWGVGAMVLVALAGIGAYSLSRYVHRPVQPDEVTLVIDPQPAAEVSTEVDRSPAPEFISAEDARPVRAAVPASPASRCDGRTMCSQMHSCEEATYFIRNCPDTKMDGDNDGRPCESQWCK